MTTTTQTARPEQVEEAALTYAAFGIPVLPVSPDPLYPDQLVPLAAPAFIDGETITEHLATTDPDVIASHWQRWPSACIATAAGTRLLAVEILAPLTSEPCSWHRGWEHTEPVTGVVERLDFIAGPLGPAPTFSTPDGGEVRFYSNEEELESWTVPRLRLRGVDDAGVLLLPNALEDWSAPPTGPLPRPPQQLVHGLAHLESRTVHALRDLDVGAHEAAGSRFDDVATALGEEGTWASASAIAKSAHLTGTKSRRLEHVKEASAHPGSGIVHIDTERGQTLFGLHTWERPAA